MNNLALFASGYLLSLSLCLDIGVFNIAMINTALRSGVRRALLFGLGSCLGDLIYAVLSLLGIGLLLQYTAVRWILYIGGSAILLYMSWHAARAVWRDGDDAHAHAAQTSTTSASLFLNGLLLTLASPSAIIWFAAVGGSMIAASSAHSIGGYFALFSGFFTAGVSWCVFIATLSVYGGRVLGSRFRQYCHAFSAVLFFYFAVRVIVAIPALPLR